MQHHISDSLDGERFNRHIINEHELAPASIQPLLEDAQAAPDSVPDIAFRLQQSILYPRDGASESTFTNSRVPLKISVIHWAAILQPVPKTILLQPSVICVQPT